MVIGRKPPLRDRRLPGRHCPGLRPSPRRHTVDLDRARNARVRNADREHLAGTDRMIRRNHQFLPIRRVRGGLSIDRDSTSREREIEIESRQILGCASDDFRRTSQLVGCRLITNVNIVAGDVISSVARSGKIRIPDAGRTWRRDRQHRYQQQIHDCHLRMLALNEGSRCGRKLSVRTGPLELGAAASARAVNNGRTSGLLLVRR